MAFSSPIFLFVFFPAAFLVCRFIPGTRGKNAALGAVSLLFYSFGGLGQLPLLPASVLVNWGAGRLLGALPKENKRPRRWIMAGAAVLNVGLLVLYKYLDFFLGCLGGIPGAAIRPVGLSLPLGISFFTFTGLGYVIEVYRKPANLCRSFGKLLVFEGMFPNLLAGPILGWRATAPQLEERTCTPEKTARGLRRFILGLGKKLLVADIVGGMVDAAFAAELPDARLAWLGAVGYAVQISFDFSGCSDMAIGLGLALGFDIPENFNRPYTALGVTDFWKRWHISLTTWFRNYLYMPLVMSRGQKRLYRAWSGKYGRERANKLAVLIPSAAVWLLTGLWHGAAWSFVLWGLWHGLFCLLEGVGVIRVDGLKKTFGGRLLLRLYTAGVVLAGAVLFRAGSLARAARMLGAMVTGFSFTAEGTFLLQRSVTGLGLSALVFGAVTALATPPASWKTRLGRRWEPLSYGLSLVLLVLCVLSLAGGGFQPFIYQQF